MLKQEILSHRPLLQMPLLQLEINFPVVMFLQMKIALKVSDKLMNADNQSDRCGSR